MAEHWYDPWPATTPRDEMYARVVRRGRRIKMVRNVIIGAGLAGAMAAGAVGYAVFGADGSSAGSAAGAVAAGGAVRPVAAYDCPGGAELSTLKGGDRVFMVGRADHEDRGWVQLRNPEVPTEMWWMPEEAVDADDSLDDLPETSCEEPGGTEEPQVEVAAGEEPAEADESTESTLEGDEPVPTLPSGEPDPDAVVIEEPGRPDTPTTRPGTPTTRPATPTTRPGTPTTNPPPTTPPDGTPPTVSGFASSVKEIRETQFGEFCSANQTTSRLSVQVTDASGVASVVLEWAAVGGGAGGTLQLAPSGGNTWAANLSVPDVSGLGPYNVSWRVRATDTRGNSTGWVGATGKPAELKVQGCG